MTIVSAFRDGLRRVLAAPAIIASLLALTLMLALPLGLILRGMIQAHLGDSLAADTLASGVNYDWWQEFSAQASGIGTTFTPTIIGFGAVLDNLSAFADNVPRATVITGAATAYLLVWAFLIGGILDRYARDRRTHAHGFFAACGVYFFRFLRLALVMWIVYYAMFRYVHPYVFGPLYTSLTADITVERTAFSYRLALYLSFGAILAAWNMVFDYAKIRAVVEDRRSMAGALVAAGRFIGRYPGATFGLYFLNVVVFALMIAVYALVAPGAGSTGAWMWIGFAIAQLYFVVRLIAKLTFYASQTTLFQQKLAHAAYTAAPLPVWPDSPSAEALSNAAR
jgi:hypothetical protein